MAIKLPSKVNPLSRPAAASSGQRRERSPRNNPIVQFAREARIELRKVVWPTRRETTRLTIVVIAVSAGTGLLLGGFDYLIAQIFNLLAH